MKMKCFTYQLNKEGGGFVQALDLNDAFDRLLDNGIPHSDIAALYESEEDHFDTYLKVRTNPKRLVAAPNKIDLPTPEYEKSVAITFNNTMYSIACYALSRGDYDLVMLVDKIASNLIKGFPEWSVEIEVSKDKVIKRLKGRQASMKISLEDVELAIENATCSLGSLGVMKHQQTISQATTDLEGQFKLCMPRWADIITSGVFKASQRLNRMFND